MNKKILVLISALMFTLGSYAVTVPAAVQKAFEQKFPKATQVKWGKEKPTEFEAEFVLDGKKMSANYSAKGEWVNTEMEIPVASFPPTVLGAVKMKFKEWKMTGGDRIETAKGTTIYEADIELNGKKKEVQFKEDGTFIK